MAGIGGTVFRHPVADVDLSVIPVAPPELQGLVQGDCITASAPREIAATSDRISGVWLETGHSCRKLSRARIVSENLRWLMPK